MKKLTFLICLVFALANTVSSQNWEKVLPNGQLSNSIYHLINPPNSSKIYAFGNELYISDDEGLTWQKNANYQALVEFETLTNAVHSPSSLISIDFVSEQVGFMSDKNRILKTIDAGTCWQVIWTGTRLNQSFPSSAFVEKIQFIDTQIGYAVGGFGRIMKTTDGGATWQLLQSNPTSAPYFHLKDVFFIDALNGYVSGYELDDFYLNIGAFKHYMLITSDGGITWTKVFPMPESDHQESKIHFFNSQKGRLLLSNQSYILPFDILLTTTNGGTTWQSLPLPNMVARDMFWLNEQVGYVIGGDGFFVGENLIAKTTDGGNTWTKTYLNGQNAFEANRCFDIIFLNNNKGVVAGASGSIAYTINGGDNWQVVKDYTWAITALDVKDNKAYALNVIGDLLENTQGQNWNITRNIGLINPTKIALLQSQEGFILANGELHYSQDGFVNLSKITERNIINIQDFTAEGNQLSAIGSELGKSNLLLAQSSNKGQTWTYKEISNNQVGLKIQKEANTILITTSQSVLKESGDNWIPVFTVNQTTQFNIVDFVALDANVYLIKTDNQKIYRTENAGQQWTEVKTFTEFYANLHFYRLNSQKVYLYGSSKQQENNPSLGTLYYSDNGGLAWQKIELPLTLERSIYTFWADDKKQYLTGGLGVLMNKNTDIPLGVGWLDFLVNRVSQEQVELIWKTNNELNNLGFHIQISENGLHFENVGWVDGRGTVNAISAYQFVHRSSQPLYYRLEQVDRDGTKSYSAIKFVDGIFGFAIYPNPTKDKVQIQLKGQDKADKLGVEIRDLKGNVVFTQVEVLEKVNASLEAITPLLSAGTYLIQIQVKSSYFVHKFIKL